jgi:hypothetical protein
MLSLSSASFFIAAAVLLAGCEPVIDTPVYVPVEPAPTIPAPDPPRTCDLGEIGACAGRCNGGDGPSCNNLGASLELGKGIALDKIAALSLYDRACSMEAEAGCVNAARLRLPAPPPEVDREKPTMHDPCGVYPPPDDGTCGSPRGPVEARPVSRGCESREKCKEACDAGDQEACKTLPGIHISGNVHIQGNVEMFGDVYVYGEQASGLAHP